MPEPQACSFIKEESLVLVFSCEFCEISKNTFFIVHLLWLLLSLLHARYLARTFSKVSVLPFGTVTEADLDGCNIQNGALYHNN